MNALTRRFPKHQFEIFGFPCDQFRNQEPGANATEILNGLKYARPGNGFQPSFVMLLKSMVNPNGEKKENPIFQFLKSRCPSPVDKFEPDMRLLYNPKNSRDIRWNFEKFLVDQNGAPVKRYYPSVNPSEIADDIDCLIRNGPFFPQNKYFLSKSTSN